MYFWYDQTKNLWSQNWLRKIIEKEDEENIFIIIDLKLNEWINKCMHVCCERIR